MEIVFDRQGSVPAYLLGETLNGRVNVSVDSAVQCEGLDLELLYIRHDHHQGKPTVIAFGELEPEHHTRAARVRLFAGSWQAGSQSYSFAIPAPWPASYDGQKSSWSWLAYARANIPWSRDCSDRAQFRVDVPKGLPLRYTPSTPVRSGGEPPTATLLKALASLMSALGRARVRGPELEAHVVNPDPTYRASPERAARALRCRAVPGPGSIVEHVTFDLQVFETTSVRVGGNERSWDRRVHTSLFEHQERVESADDVYVSDMPLPAPETLSFSTGKDDFGRGVIWRLTATVVRATESAEKEVTSCEIDVRPDMSDGRA